MATHFSPENDVYKRIVPGDVSLGGTHDISVGNHSLTRSIQFYRSSVSLFQIMIAYHLMPLNQTFMVSSLQ